MTGLMVDSKGKPNAMAGELAQRVFQIARLLIPIDFSDESLKAVRYGAAFAAKFDASFASGAYRAACSCLCRV